MWPASEKDFGALLTRYLNRKGMTLEELAQALQALGYSREAVHPGCMIAAMTDREGHRWRNNPNVVNGIAEVLELTSEESFELMNAYLYRPPESPRRGR